jgi:intein/homing endonuclease
VWNEDRGYYYGVILGDGFYEQTPSGTPPYIMLKACDKDFVEYWTGCVNRITGGNYTVGKNAPGSPKHRAAYRCKSYNKELVAETVETTRGKTIIPNGIKTAGISVKKAFLQGLMDSEGFIRMSLSPLKASTVSLEFACTEPWVPEVREMFGEVGILTTPVTRRKFKEDPKYQKIRKDLLSFKIDILEYVDAGMKFNIKRKQDRLEYISQILRDFTRDYPRYETYYERGS